MIVSLPRFGTGIRSVFEGSPTSVIPVKGRLKMASRNIALNRNTIKRKVMAFNEKAIRDAKEVSSLVNIKA